MRQYTLNVGRRSVPIVPADLVMQLTEKHWSGCNRNLKETRSVSSEQLSKLFGSNTAPVDAG